MNLAQYNALAGDTKLAAALAIAMGWHYINFTGGRLCVREEVYVGCYGEAKIFNPFTDDSIPYGLPVDISSPYQSGWSAWCNGNNVTHKSKTHATVRAYIAADPSGHLNKFLSTKE